MLVAQHASYLQPKFWDERCTANMIRYTGSSPRSDTAINQVVYYQPSGQSSLLIAQFLFPEACHVEHNSKINQQCPPVVEYELVSCLYVLTLRHLLVRVKYMPVSARQLMSRVLDMMLVPLLANSSKTNHRWRHSLTGNMHHLCPIAAGDLHNCIPSKQPYRQDSQVGFHYLS
jgi:hypothetical protein